MVERSCRLRVEAPRLLRKVGGEGFPEVPGDPTEEGTGKGGIWGRAQVVKPVSMHMSVGAGGTRPGVGVGA